ncbi:MAG: hypothetical protein CFE24_00665 [Flavobacterium sp. BFFFF2]|nr:MAG: hypothetical protein CFE24_00665 [Flavobacterium sp. BFFFF2]
MNLQQNKYLADILESIQCIDDFTGPTKQFNNFEKSKMMQAAVERHVEIIGEATKKLLEINPTIPITNARKIVNTRNKIAHGYDEIELAEIWNIVINHLPVLKKEVQFLL